MQDLEGDVLSREGACEEDRLDPDDVEDPDERDAGDDPQELAYPGTGHRICDAASHDQEADDGVHTSARGADAEGERRAGVLDDEQPVAAARLGQRHDLCQGDRRQRRELGGNVEDPRQDPLEGDGPGQEEEQDRALENPHMADAVEQADHARDEERQAQEVEPLQPEPGAQRGRHDDRDHPGEDDQRQPDDVVDLAIVDRKQCRLSGQPVPPQGKGDQRNQAQIRQGRLQGEAGDEGGDGVVVGEPDERQQHHRPDGQARGDRRDGAHGRCCHWTAVSGGAITSRLRSRTC
jgi:hypothetical protein